MNNTPDRVLILFSVNAGNSVTKFSDLSNAHCDRHAGLASDSQNDGHCCTGRDARWDLCVDLVESGEARGEACEQDRCLLSADVDRNRVRGDSER